MNIAPGFRLARLREVPPGDTAAAGWAQLEHLRRVDDIVTEMAPTIGRRRRAAESSGNAHRPTLPAGHDTRPQRGGHHVPHVPVPAAGAGVDVQRLAMPRAHRPRDRLRVCLGQIDLLAPTAPLHVHGALPFAPTEPGTEARSATRIHLGSPDAAGSWTGPMTALLSRAARITPCARARVRLRRAPRP